MLRTIRKVPWQQRWVARISNTRKEECWVRGRKNLDREEGRRRRGRRQDVGEEGMSYGVGLVMEIGIEPSLGRSVAGWW